MSDADDRMDRHPNYGPCDGFGPERTCSVCRELDGLDAFVASPSAPVLSPDGTGDATERPPGKRKHVREDWRTRKPRHLPDTSTCGFCNRPAPLVFIDEEVTWGALSDGFAATPVKVRSWLYRCESCKGHEGEPAHEWYTVEASREHESTVWRATMYAMSDEILALRATVASLTRERDDLLRFAGKAVKEARIEDLGGDWDGGAIEDAMVECGLLAETTALEACGETCTCRDYDEFPLTCYRLTDLGRRAARSAHQKPDQ